jgi:hypothetical protein
MTGLTFYLYFGLASFTHYGIRVFLDHNHRSAAGAAIEAYIRGGLLSHYFFLHQRFLSVTGAPPANIGLFYPILYTAVNPYWSIFAPYCNSRAVVAPVPWDCTLFVLYCTEIFNLV